jgi:hypothetical protein
VQVKATNGSTRLGGEAFDIRLTYLLAEEFQRQQMPLARREPMAHGTLPVLGLRTPHGEQGRQLHNLLFLPVS